MKRVAHLLMLAAAFTLGGCKWVDPQADINRPETSRDFPKAQRAVSNLGSNQFSTEIQRDSVGEAQKVSDGRVMITGRARHPGLDVRVRSPHSAARRSARDCVASFFGTQLPTICTHDA